jgi:O-antigen ligase
VILSVFVFSSKRFKELYKKENYSNVLEFNSTSLRFGIYNCAIQKIKESPIFGYGLGDVQDELTKCYEEKSELLTEIVYNSHNQYLSFFLSSGVFGFLTLLFTMFSILTTAFKRKNIILMSITLFFIIIMMFENILERQSGVIMFSFYICLFSLYRFTDKEQIKITNEG